MPQDEIGRRALMVGAGCAALALIGGCKSGNSQTDDRQTAPLVPAADVPVGGGVLTADGVLVLQLRVGEFTAFSATCPHQSYLVRPPDSEGIMTCTGHQSKFRALDGVRVDGPAMGNLTPIQVKVSGADIIRA